MDGYPSIGSLRGQAGEGSWQSKLERDNKQESKVDGEDKFDN